MIDAVASLKAVRANLLSELGKVDRAISILTGTGTRKAVHRNGTGLKLRRARRSRHMTRSQRLAIGAGVRRAHRERMKKNGARKEQ